MTSNNETENNIQQGRERWPLFIELVKCTQVRAARKDTTGLKASRGDLKHQVNQRAFTFQPANTAVKPQARKAGH